MQRHDITKKRIDTDHNVLGERQDGIGAPKVCANQSLTFNEHAILLTDQELCLP